VATMLIQGQCHCGNLAFELSTEVSESQIEPRACDCTFCRTHGAKNWSDPNGKTIIRVKERRSLQKYTFALMTADFFICRVCGAYLGAVLRDEDGMWSTVNMRLTRFHDLPASLASYGSEEAKERIFRRKRAWTPTTVI
jgi:hypothetical protein